jgi:signal transduction histidine kinase/GAF domain-containing protein
VDEPSLQQALMEKVLPLARQRPAALDALLALFANRVGGPASLVLWLPVGHDAQAAALEPAAIWPPEGATGGARPPGRGICEHVLQTGRAYRATDLAHDPWSGEAGRRRGGSLFAIPLGPERNEGQAPALGVLSVWDRTPAAWSEAQEARIASAARQAAPLLDLILAYHRLEEDVGDSERRLAAKTDKLRVERDRADFLYHVTQEMTRTLDLDRVLNRTLARISTTVGVQQGSILLLDPTSEYLVYRAAIGRPVLLPHGGMPTRYRRGVGLGGWVLEHRQSAIVDRLEQDPRWVPDPNAEVQSQSALAVPLNAGGEVLGAMLLFHPQEGFFNQDHLALAMAAANHVAIAVKNAEMYRLIREQAERLGRMLREQRSVAAQRMAILASIADGVVLADDQGRVVVANQAAREVLGRLGGDGLPGPARDLAGLHVAALFESCPEEAQEAIHAAIAAVGSQSARARARAPVSVLVGCAGRSVQATLTAMLDERPRQGRHDAGGEGRHDAGGEGPQLAGTVIVLRDVTDELEVAQAKTEFVSLVSHELRTPMTSIKGYTDLVLRGAAGELNEQQRQFLGIVKANVDRMADLVSDLLDISRIEAGRLYLEPEPLDLGGVILEISEELSESLRQRELALRVELQPGLPRVYADRRRVVQVLLNLLSNAYRYTPPGGTITIAVHARDERVQIDVIDTGIGIPEQIRAKIFERFYRADHPVVRQQTGTGLGLPIAKSLIEMHGGELTLHSEVDQGSTFSFTLPVDAGQEVAGREAAGREDASREAAFRDGQEASWG